MPLEHAAADSAWNWHSPRIALALGIPFALALVCIAIVNLYVNPFQLYWSTAFRPAASNLRMRKFELAKANQEEPRTLIVGSSRVMMMDPQVVERYLPGPCFNFGMQGGTAEDYYAVLRAVVDEAGLPIQHVILGIDYEAFNPCIPTMCESRYFPEFSQYLVYSDVEQSRSKDRWSLLLSLQQFDESLSVMRGAHSREQSSESLLIAADGMATQVAREEAIASGTFDLQRILSRRVRKYPSRSLRLDGFKQIDPVRLQYFDDMLSYCKTRGIELTAFITPYHPTLWEVIDNLPQSKILEQLEAELAKRCADYGVELKDYSRITAFAGDPELFYDEIHMRPANETRIVEALFRGESASPVNGNAIH